MADIIDSIVSKDALEQVKELKKLLNSLLSDFSKATEVATKFTKELEGKKGDPSEPIKKVTKALTEQEKAVKAAVVTNHKIIVSETKAHKLAIQRKVDLAETNRLIREEKKLKDAARNSIGRANLLIAKWTREQAKLNTATEEGVRLNKAYNKAIAKADKFRKANINSVEKQRLNIGNYNKALGGLRYTMLGFLSVGAGMAAVFSQIKKGMGDARTLEGVKIAFDKLNDPQLLSNLQKATKNTVNNLDLMKAGVQAKNLGVPIKQLGTLFGFAQQRALETGESVDYLVDSIVKGIGRKSPLILDNLGISAIALKDKLGGVAAASASVGQVAEAVGKIIEEEQQNSGKAIDLTQSSLLRAQSAWENMRTELGVSLLPVIASLTSAVVELGIEILKIPRNFKKLEESNETVKKLSKSTSSLVNSFKPLVETVGAIFKRLASVVGWFYSKIWIPFVTKVLDVWAERLKFLSSATNAFGEMFKTHVKAMEKESVKLSKVLKDIFSGDLASLKADLSTKLTGYYNYFKSLGNAALRGWKAGASPSGEPITVDYFVGDKKKLVRQPTTPGKQAGAELTKEEIAAAKRRAKAAAAEAKRIAKEKARLAELERKAKWDLMVELLQIQSDGNKNLRDNENNSLDQRLEAAYQYAENKLAIVDAQEKKELGQSKLTTSQIKLIHVKATREREKVLAEHRKKSYDIIVKADEKELKRAEEHSKSLYKEFEISKQSGIVSLIEQLEIAETILENQELLGDEKIKLQRHINKITQELREENEEKQELQDEKELEKMRKHYATLQKIIEELAGSLKDFSALATEARLEAIGAEMNALKIRYDLEEKLITHSADTQEEKDRKITRLTLQRATQERVLAEESLRIRQRQAKFDKAVNIAAIISTTALAIITQWKDGLAATRLPRSIAAGLTGAAALAKAIAAPIPQFAEGTSSAPGGYAIVGERGKELVIEPSGKKYITPSTDTLVELPKGSKVIPNHNLDSYLYANPRINRFSSTSTGATIVDFNETNHKLDILNDTLKKKNLSVTYNNRDRSYRNSKIY